MHVIVWLSQCHGSNAKGEPCKFFWRSSKSPSASPTLSSQLTFTAPPLLSTTSVPVSQGTGKCLIVGCGQSCIANDCPRKVCRKHCIERGGCLSKKHRASTVPAHTMPSIVPHQTPLAPPIPPFVVPHHLSLPWASTCKGNCGAKLNRILAGGPKFNIL